jgi:alkanesulfonate monooxygenase SsuD/methylene tetrahydromethanopterin reductase-like flavin-dependent oxidoreductase (luciferase family)
LKGTYTGRTDVIRAQGLEYLRENHILIAGTPDSVEKQIRSLYEKLGGLDHLLMMMQCGYLSHEKTMKNIRLFTQEVMPRLKDLKPAYNRPWGEAAE